MKNPRRRIGNVDFTVMTLEGAVQELLCVSRDIASTGNPGVAVHFANAYNVALAKSDSAYAHLLNKANYVFSDGVPITWVGKRAYPLVADSWQRVYGPDVMTLVFEQSTPKSPRHYLLGSTPEVLGYLRSNLENLFPQAHIVGHESPPFTSPTSAELSARDARIRDSGATMVWVGLGTPKQDYEVARLSKELPVMALAVGAAFDFLAGTTPQAPRWMQRSGLEWFHRLAKEPKRLSHRYVWGNSVFIVESLRTVCRDH